jgi:hypothetical protein
VLGRCLPYGIAAVLRREARAQLKAAHIGPTDWARTAGAELSLSRSRVATAVQAQPQTQRC